MKRNMLMSLIVAALASTSFAGTWYTMTGDDFSTTSGYPWTSTDTNYNVKLMTAGTAEAKYTNAYLPDYGLSYDNFEQLGQVVLTGSFSPNDLQTLCSSSYVQIGLMTEAIIDNSEHGYASYQFNDSAMLSVSNAGTAGQYNINVTDYNLSGGRRSTSMTFDGSKQLDYQLTFDFDTDYASLVINNNDGSGWSSAVGTTFGISDWGAFGLSGSGNFDLIQPEDFSSAALFANIYNENATSGTLSQAGFGNVSVSSPNLSNSSTSASITGTGSFQRHFWVGSEASEILEVVFDLDSGSSLDFTATESTDPADYSALVSAMNTAGVSGEISQVWNFETGGFAFGTGESVALTFHVDPSATLDDINLWHNDGSGWSLVDLTDEGINVHLADGVLIYSGVDDFSSYGVTVPEPASLSLLALGGLALLRRRNRQLC
jgi:hypothetical protein